MHNILNMQTLKRVGMALGGTIISGFCVGAFQKADLGVDPFTCLITAFANLFQSTYSVIYLIVTGILLLLAFLINRTCVGIATVFNLFGIGLSADFMRGLLNQLIPNPNLTVRFVILGFAIIVISFSTSLYFTANLGVSAYDAVALTIANKYKIGAFRLCRIATDIICIVIGFFCNVTIGPGTVITAFMMGPIIQWFNKKISEPLLYGTVDKKKK